MEKNSTPRADLLPRAANLATLAVVVSAMWWSGAQRPAGHVPALAAAQAPAVAETNDALSQRQPAVLTAISNPTGATTAANWPAQTATTIAREGLQAVGYQTRTR